MRCQNCGFKNVDSASVCEKCNADFSMRNQFYKMGTVPRTSFSSCLTNCFTYSLILTLVIITIAAVAAFNCIFRIPEIPDKNYPPIVVDAWEVALEMQVEKCGEFGYAGE